MAQDSEIDALFAIPLAEFTAARNALASRLKKEGRASEAERVKAMAKPSATAWAVNQLYWQQPKELERLLIIGEKLREAQKKGMDRALLEERRKVVSDLTKRASEMLRDSGHAVSPEAARKMTITLESLASWGQSNDQVQPGRLVVDLEPLGFDGLAALMGGESLEPAKVLQFRRAAKEKKSAEEIATAQARAAEVVKAAERKLVEARREAEQKEAALAKASSRAEALEKEKHELDVRCRKAQEDARSAANEAKKAAQSVAEAERAVAKAREAL